MAVLPILRWPDPRLATRCAPVKVDAEARRLAHDMLDTMYAAPGRGLAAPQVGVLRRVFVMDPAWKDGRPAPVILMNPSIIWASARRIRGPEGCLSIPGVTADVDRAAEVRLRWTAADGTLREETFGGFAAICAQHEMDHLDGIVTLDHLAPDVRATLEAEALA
jgi:peptide deformylase